MAKQIEREILANHGDITPEQFWRELTRKMYAKSPKSVLVAIDALDKKNPDNANVMRDELNKLAVGRCGKQ